jgi:hypothetical protein
MEDSYLFVVVEYFRPSFCTRHFLVPEARLPELGVDAADIDAWSKHGFCSYGQTPAELQRTEAKRNALIRAFKAASWVHKSSIGECAFVAPDGTCIKRVMMSLPHAI